MSICGTQVFDDMAGTDSTGRHIYLNGPFTYSIKWNNTLNRWEIAQVSGPVLYSNTFASAPDPPCLTSGTWQMVNTVCGILTNITGDCNLTDAQNHTQTVTAIQYYFDTDPGVGVTGNGGILSVTPTVTTTKRFLFPFLP